MKDYKKYIELRDTGKIPFILVKGFRDFIRIASEGDITPFNYVRMKGASKPLLKRYQSIYGVAKQEYVKKIISRLKKIKKLNSEIQDLKNMAWNDKQDIQLSDFEVIYSKVDKQRYKKYLGGEK